MGDRIDQMKQRLDYVPEVTEDLKTKARRTVALSVPKDEVHDLLAMLGLT